MIRSILSNWAVAFNGAEPVREHTIENFSRYFEPCGFNRDAFYPCYGMAENTLIISGGYRDSPPVVRYFDSKSLESHEVVDAQSDESNARTRRLRRNITRRRNHHRQSYDDESLRAPDEVGEI